MKAEKYLNDMNISLGQARAFIQSNLSTPEFLLHVLEEYQVNNDMVAEIMGDLPPGQVVRFFARHGLDSSILDKFQHDDKDDDSVDDDDSSEETPTADDTGYGSDAIELTVNSSLDASIGEEMESDLYAINLTAGLNYSFTVASDDIFSPYLILRDEDGKRIASDHQALDESEATFTFTASDSGSFYLDLSDLDDDAVGDYNISFSVIDDFVADASTTGLIEFGLEGLGSASGTLEVGEDTDWFGITLAAGEYDIAFTSDTITSGDLKVYDADSQLVVEFASDDDDGVLAFSTETGGNYFIEVSSSDTQSTGTYIIGVSEQAEAILA